MLKASGASVHIGLLLWWSLFLWGADGYIEIVEEQRCHNYRFRLTCRELTSHIAVLEAWYASMHEYYRVANTSVKPPSKTERDAELDRVFVYSSPKHNGVYVAQKEFSPVSVNNNTSVFSNDIVTKDNESIEELVYVNETVNMVEYLRAEECAAPSFLRSYGSWREGDKRRRRMQWSSSRAVNLRAPVSYRCIVVFGNWPEVTLAPRDVTLRQPELALMFVKCHVPFLKLQCTGVNHCSFILEQDYPPAVSWSVGVVYIKYACFDDSLSLHYCNREVRIADLGPESEGYIRTPGYPHFYVGDECRWRLQANPEQRIRVTLLDVSLRSIGPFEDQCTDYVTVLDSSGEVLLSSCDQVELPLRLLSSTNVVDITVEAKSKGAFPKRGVLLYYKSIGCVTLPAPSNGYLVYRDAELAHYMCNVNMVFDDTRQRARVLWCYDDNRWNDTVPLCVDISPANITSTSNKDLEFRAVDKPNKNLPHKEANMLVDIVIPSLLIAALFIGNAFIVLIIYKYRKRKTDDLEDEFNTIPLSSNGNLHSAGNAV